MVSIRKISVIGKTYRHLNRYRQIITILFRYGFEDLIDRLHIDQYIELGLQMITRNKKEQVERYTRAERFRLLFEELGPTFIKLGQILSTRPDIIPNDVIAEFELLQDSVAPFEFEAFLRTIAWEFRTDPSEMFEMIDETPIASASIGQVHKARLMDGDEVAIKVQRPGIRKIIEVDLEIMLHLAMLMERHVEEAAIHRPVKVVEEFAKILEKELDYCVEAANMERISDQFQRDRTIYIPKAYSELITHKVLTMEYIDGIKVSEVKKLEEAGLNTKTINRYGADFILKQVFDFGFFHADPHPGNIFVLADNVVCPVDYGMVGVISQKQRELFIDLLENVAKKEPGRVARLLLAIGNYDQEPDMELFEKEIEDFMGLHLFKALKDIDVGRLIQDFLDIATRFKVSVPPDIFLMLKAFAAVEGISLLLDPEFDMITHTEPFIRKAKFQRYSPKRIISDVMNISTDMLNLLRIFPGEMVELSRLLKSEKITLRFELKELGILLTKMDQVSNRLSFSIVIGALIMGSAMILSSEIPPKIYGVSLIGLLGFSFAAILGIWLLIAIIKKGKL